MSGYDDDWEYPEPQGGRSALLSETEFDVTTPWGSVQPVMTLNEQEWLTAKVDLYQDQIQFSNVSDLQDLDRVLFQELMVYRWKLWLGRGGADYDGIPVDIPFFAKQSLEFSRELRQIKKNLGIDKPARDRTKGEGSLPHYWAMLLERAKAFGVMRNEQFHKSIELLNQLFGMATFYRNATEEERKEFHHTADDIIEWVLHVAQPEYDEIDRAFRQDGPDAQKIWIRRM